MKSNGILQTAYCVAFGLLIALTMIAFGLTLVWTWFAHHAFWDCMSLIGGLWLITSPIMFVTTLIVVCKTLEHKPEH